MISTVESAIARSAAAAAAVAALATRLGEGDTTVTGSMLNTARADVDVATALLAAAQAAAAAATAAALAKAATVAFDKLVADYEFSAAIVTDSLTGAVQSLVELLIAADKHAVTTAVNFNEMTAFGDALDPTIRARLQSRVFPGIGQVTTPDSNAILDGLVVLARQRAGLRAEGSYPEILVEAISPFIAAT